MTLVYLQKCIVVRYSIINFICIGVWYIIFIFISTEAKHKLMNKHLIINHKYYVKHQE